MKTRVSLKYFVRYCSSSIIGQNNIFRTNWKTECRICHIWLPYLVLIFSLKKFFLYFMKWNFLAPKFTKVLYSLKKLFLKFREIELSKPEIKTFLILYSTNVKIVPWKEILMLFLERNLLLKNFLYVKKWSFLARSLKKHYISIKKLFLISSISGWPMINALAF